MFSRLRIKWKLTSIIVLPAGLALLFACIVLYRHQKTAYLQATVREVSLLTRLLANNVQGALAFSDMELAAKTLAALRAFPRVESAVIFDSKKLKTLSRYDRDPVKGPPPGPPTSEGIVTAADHITVTQRVMSDLEVLGLVTVRSGLGEMEERLSELGDLIWKLFVCFSVATLALSLILQRSISGPIRALSETAHLVSTSQDYSLRAVKQTEDELGELNDRFNDMLGTIERNTAQLEDVARRERDQAVRKESEKAALTRLIESHVAVIRRLGEGDLTVSFTEEGSPELVMLSRHLNLMVGRIATLIAQMQMTVLKVGNAATEIEVTLGQQNDNFATQREVATRTGDSVNGLKGAASNLVELAQNVTERASSASRVFGEGEVALGSTLTSNEVVSKFSRESEALMRELMIQLNKIEDILSTVNDVSEQSKLLALNAAIEAARAREFGKGFSVVAMEVRNLAAQSKEAATQIKIILQGIRDVSARVGGAFSRSLGELEGGAQHLARLRMVQQQLKSHLDTALGLAGTVQSSSRSQFLELGRITEALRENLLHMDANLRSSQDIQASMSDLADMSRSLQSTVELFKSR